MSSAQRERQRIGDFYVDTVLPALAARLLGARSGQTRIQPLDRTVMAAPNSSTIFVVDPDCLAPANDPDDLVRELGRERGLA